MLPPGSIRAGSENTHQFQIQPKDWPHASLSPLCIPPTHRCLRARDCLVHTAHIEEGEEEIPADWPYNTPCVFKNIRLRFTLWVLLRWPEAIRDEGPREHCWKYWPFLIYIVLKYTEKDVIQWTLSRPRLLWDTVYPLLVFTGEGVVHITEQISHCAKLCYQCGVRRLCGISLEIGVACYRDWNHHVFGSRWHH